MTQDQIIFVSAQGWCLFKGGTCLPIPAWPRLDGSALVVVDFDPSVSGVQACKGRPEFAAAQIEKGVRTEGLLEGPLQVIIHKQIRHADSSTALYTALPLDGWQQLQSWARSQRDHCLLLPLVAMLPRQRAQGWVHVLRCGVHLRAYCESDGKMHYADTAALGTTLADMQAPLRALMAQLRTSLGGDIDKGVFWSSIQADDIANERALAHSLHELTGKEVRLLEQQPMRTGSGAQKVSALPGLMDGMEPRSVSVSGLARLAWKSESSLLPLAAMVMVVALGLGAFALFSHQQAQRETLAADSQRGALQSLRERALRVNQSVPAPQSERDGAWVRELGQAALYDPVRMLTTLRRAAGPWVRIRSLQLQKAEGKEPARYVIEGVVTAGDNEALSHLLSALKREGWQADPATPADASVGAFAYRLRPLSASSI